MTCRGRTGRLGGVVLSTVWMASAARGEPLDLAACVRLALSANPAVQDASDASTAASLRHEAALADYRFQFVPSIDGGLQGANQTNQRFQLLLTRKFLPTGTEVSLSGGTSVFSSVPQISVPYFTEARISVAQPLLQGRSRLENRERLDEALRRMSAAEHALAAARQDLALQVVRGYYDVVGAAELVRVAERSLGRVRELRELAEAKLSLGAASKMDVFRAELHAARIENALLEQNARRDSSLDALKLLLGLDPRVNLEIEERLQGPAPVDLAGEDPVETALERRVELSEARSQVADAERRVLLARYRLWPAVFVTGLYARQGLGRRFGDSFALDRDEWGLGLRSSLPLDRTAEQVALAEAELELRRAEREYRRIRDQVVREVREAQRQLSRSRAERALAAEVLAHAEQQADLARFRYDRGVTNNFDLVQAEEELAEARSRQVLSAIQEALAAASVRRATGTLVEALAAASEPANP